MIECAVCLEHSPMVIFIRREPSLPLSIIFFFPVDVRWIKEVGSCRKHEGMASETSTYDPWLLAKGRYLDGLEPHEKVLFHEASLENLYYGTSNLERDDRNSKSRKIIEKLQPLVEKIEDYGKALDAYANIAPAYISPIWGSIRVLIVIARAYGKFYDRIVETLGRIGDILPRFRKYGMSRCLHPILNGMHRRLRKDFRQKKASKAYSSNFERLSRHHKALF
jgi:hypothetical protein